MLNLNRCLLKRHQPTHNMKKDNLTVVLAKYARELNISINLNEVYNELLIHPDYPSLLAVSDVLQNFGVENGAYRIDKEQLPNIPVPFIAHTTLNQGDFLLVSKIEDGKVIVSSEKWNRHKMDIAEFSNMFNGIVLSAEADPEANSRSFFPGLSKVKMPLAIGFILVALLASVGLNTNYLNNLTWQVLLLTLAKTAGMVTSVLLLIQSIDSNNPLVQKLCHGGSKTSCNDILSSKAAKVFEGLSWSEVGFFYFTGTWLFLLFGGAAPGVMLVLAALNVISLPYTFYSVYYQARVAKKWCVLCCTVQGLLWVEFIAIAASFHLPLITPALPQLCLLFMTLILPIAAWLLLKPLFLKAQQIHPLKVQLQKFKYNTDLFNASLIAQPKYAQPDETWSIVLGNTDAENVITMVTNPYCPPCAKTHKLLHELLEQRDDLQARIVFTADNTDDDFKTPVSRHLMTLHGLPDKTIVTRALYDWYEQKQKDYQAWAKAYPTQLNETEYNKLNKQKAWCELAEVTATPTMLYNGHKLPGLYQLNDLKYMLQ